MFDSVLVANRGEIARRIMRTARKMGLRTVAVYSEADAGMPHVKEADEAVLVGPGPATDSYLVADRIMDAARMTGVGAIHPGYGFLSENPKFAQAVLEAGLVWVGPTPDTITAMGNKVNARNLVEAAGVPVAPGSDHAVKDVPAALQAARASGYPVIVKPAAGGGGIGMSVAWNDEELRAAFDVARTRAERAFADASVFVERYLPRARHVEVQVLGLADGRVIGLGERDCSVQRRHQKVAEETPSPGIGAELRQSMVEGAVRVAQAVGYRNAGTVECLVDAVAQEYVFLEMNTRLQVEHPVTELVTGIDLVEEQFRAAAGDAAGFDPDGVTVSGHAIELRVYAEDPKRFLPSPGAITVWEEPEGEGIRVDAGYGPGTTVSPYYDPLLAKLCVHGEDRRSALELARRAADSFRIEGPKTNLAFFQELLQEPAFVSGAYDTHIIDTMRE